MEALTHRSAEPVSKLRLKTLAGVPIWTGQRYWRSYSITFAGTFTGRVPPFTATTRPLSRPSTLAEGLVTGALKGFGLVG